MTIEQLSEEKKKLDEAITRVITDSPLNSDHNIKISGVDFAFYESVAPGQAPKFVYATTHLEII